MRYDPSDPDALLTTREAAELAGVAPPTIQSWANRGKLTRAGIDRTSGAAMYRLLDVAKAEYATRRGGHPAARRTVPA